MNSTKLLTMVVTAMVLIGGAAAVGAAVPAQAQNDDVPDDADANDTDDDDDAAANATDDDEGIPDDAGPDGVGPAGGLPEQVPDHVSRIHDTIESFLSGSVDDLGSALSGLLGE